MISGAIFDLDGTLLDSMDVWDTAGENYLKSLGIEPKENLRERLETFSLYDTACLFRSEYGIKLTEDEIMKEINESVEDFYFNKAVLKPGAAEFLGRLKESGVRMCIATVTDSYLAGAALSRCGVLEYFSGIVTCAEVGSNKEKPDIYRKALQLLGTDRSNTAVFEDAAYAVETAKNDGFITVAVFDKHEKEQNKIKKTADFYITDYKVI